MTASKRLLSLSLFILMGLLIISCGSPAPQLQPLSSQDVIVAFGDSLTYGTGAPKDKSYPAVLEQLIGIKVVNEGVPGEETSGGLQRIGDVLEKYHPSLVILGLGGNDLIRKRSPEKIKSNLQKIIQKIRNAGVEVILLVPPKPSLGLAVPDFYAELGAEFNIPVDETSLPELLRQSEMKSDYIHLNAAGYQALAESIAVKLKASGALNNDS